MWGITVAALVGGCTPAVRLDVAVAIHPGSAKPDTAWVTMVLLSVPSGPFTLRTYPTVTPLLSCGLTAQGLAGVDCVVRVDTSASSPAVVSVHLPAGHPDDVELTYGVLLDGREGDDHLGWTGRRTSHSDRDFFVAGARSLLLLSEHLDR